MRIPGIAKNHAGSSPQMGRASATPRPTDQALQRPSGLNSAPPQVQAEGGQGSASLAPRRGLSLGGFDLVGHRPGKPAVSASPDGAPAATSFLPKLSDWLPFKLKPSQSRRNAAPELAPAAKPTAEANATSSARRADSLDHLPDRLKAKLERADAIGQTPDARLNEYAQAASVLLRKNVQPDSEMTSMDIANLPTLARTENARHPGLNLRTFTDVESFVDAVADPEAGHFRAIVPMQFQEKNLLSSIHHVMADVRAAPGMPPSIIFLESGLLDEGQYVQHKEVWDMLKGHGLDPSRVGVIETAAQKSPNDCVMFALNFALKSREHQPVLDEMHENLRANGQLTKNADFERAVGAGRGVIGTYGPEIAKVHLGGINFAAGADVLPSAFYKHTHSKAEANTLDKAAAKQSGATQTADKPDNLGKHSSPLAQRVDDFRVNRLSEHGVEQSYSASIEGFRMQEIARAKTHVLGALDDQLAQATALRDSLGSFTLERLEAAKQVQALEQRRAALRGTEGARTSQRDTKA